MASMEMFGDFPGAQGKMETVESVQKFKTTAGNEQALRGIAFWTYTTSLVPRLKDGTLHLETMISIL